MSFSLIIIGVVGTLIGLAVIFNARRLRVDGDTFSIRQSRLYSVLGVAAIVLTWLLIVGLF